MQSDGDGGEVSAEEDIALARDLIKLCLYTYAKLKNIEVTPNKSRNDLLREAGMMALEERRRFVEDNSYGDPKWGTNWMPSLLEAMNQVTNEMPKVILAGLWIEHWVNDMIRCATERAGLSNDCFKMLVRKLGSPSEKFTAAWPLLDLEEIPEQLRKMVERVMQLRNECIHYKMAGL